MIYLLFNQIPTIITESSIKPVKFTLKLRMLLYPQSVLLHYFLIMGPQGDCVVSLRHHVTGQNKEPGRQRFLQRESREGREDMSSPIWIFKAEHYVDNQIGPSAIHLADFAGSGEVALNHHE